MARPKKLNLVAVTTHIDKDLRDKIQLLADKENSSLYKYLREAIEAYFEDITEEEITNLPSIDEDEDLLG